MSIFWKDLKMMNKVMFQKFTARLTLTRPRQRKIGGTS